MLRSRKSRIVPRRRQDRRRRAAGRPPRRSSVDESSQPAPAASRCAREVGVEIPVEDPQGAAPLVGEHSGFSASRTKTTASSASDAPEQAAVGDAREQPGQRGALEGPPNRHPLVLQLQRDRHGDEGQHRARPRAPGGRASVRQAAQPEAGRRAGPPRSAACATGSAPMHAAEAAGDEAAAAPRGRTRRWRGPPPGAARAPSADRPQQRERVGQEQQVERRGEDERLPPRTRGPGGWPARPQRRQRGHRARRHRQGRPPGHAVASRERRAAKSHVEGRQRADAGRPGEAAAKMRATWPRTTAAAAAASKCSSRRLSHAPGERGPGQAERCDHARPPPWTPRAATARPGRERPSADHDHLRGRPARARCASPRRTYSAAAPTARSSTSEHAEHRPRRHRQRGLRRDEQRGTSGRRAPATSRSRHVVARPLRPADHR